MVLYTGYKIETFTETWLNMQYAITTLTLHVIISHFLLTQQQQKIKGKKLNKNLPPYTEMCWNTVI